MKTIYLLVAMMFLAPLSLKAQYDYDFFAVGLTGSLPVGDPADFADFGVGVEAIYLKDVIGPLILGGGIGYDRYFVDNQDSVDLPGVQEIRGPGDDLEFAHVVGKALYALGEQGFGLGLDLGYSFALGDTDEGGFTYEPKAYLNLEKLIITLGYKGINTSDRGTYDFVNVGVKYKI